MEIQIELHGCRQVAQHVFFPRRQVQHVTLSTHVDDRVFEEVKMGRVRDIDQDPQVSSPFRVQS